MVPEDKDNNRMAFTHSLTNARHVKTSSYSVCVCVFIIIQLITHQAKSKHKVQFSSTLHTVLFVILVERGGCKEQNDFVGG